MSMIPLFRWRSAIAQSELQPTTRHVLLTLSLHMNELGENCFPSTRTLAKETGLSERSVCTHLQMAKELGWLIKELHRYTSRGWPVHSIPRNLVKRQRLGR